MSPRSGAVGVGVGGGVDVGTSGAGVAGATVACAGGEAGTSDGKTNTVVKTPAANASNSNVNNTGGRVKAPPDVRPPLPRS